MILQDVCHVLSSVHIIPCAEEVLLHAANVDNHLLMSECLHIYYITNCLGQ